MKMSLEIVLVISLCMGVLGIFPRVRKGKGEFYVDVIFEEDSSRCAVALSFKKPSDEKQQVELDGDNV